MTALLDRLRERKLVQWALAYLAGAWVLLQVLDLLSNTYTWAPAIMRLLPVLLGVGFCAALVLAWYHGEKGQQRISGPELLILAAVLAVGGGVLWLLGRPAPPTAEAAAASTSPSSEQPFGSTVVPERSIAVLPFVNLSESKENEYFSDGVTEEILTTLANVGELRVISRTSVMQYKGSTKPLREIASELGVAHVLEGSVQRAGDRVRIRAQLIDAATDQHLWGERYDRPLEDIFAVQSEIAQQIAQALQVRVSEAEKARVVRAPTATISAHGLLLHARQYARGDPRDLDIALAMLRRARELDPNYPDVHAELSNTFLILDRRTNPGPEERRLQLDSAVVAARRAIELDPDFAPGYAALGFALDLRGDRDAALQAHQRAVHINSSLSAGLANVYEYSFGRLDEAARWWKPALRADPTNRFIVFLAGRTYVHLGMPDRARPLLEKAIALAPGFSWPVYYLSLTYLQQGRPEEARATIRRMLDATAGPNDVLVGLTFASQAAAAWGDLEQARHYAETAGDSLQPKAPAGASLPIIVWGLQRSGQTARADTLLRRISGATGSPRRPEEYVDLVRLRILQADRGEALRLFEQAVEQGWRLYNDRPNDPILNSLRGDPRYDRLMAEVKEDIAQQRARVEREGW